MAYSVDYKGFIETYYYLKTKTGEINRFTFNEPQNHVYGLLQDTYGENMQGIRENFLKGRQFGISTMITGILTTDFILAALGEIPQIDGDIYSHKDKETASHFTRVNMFLDSYLLASQGGDYKEASHREAIPTLRKAFLKVDTTNLIIAKNGVQLQTATAGAKVSGRGSTRQNLHWTEPAFYPNTPILSAESLITGAEEQVPDGFGKIFRESTGNMLGDFYSKEYFDGKEGRSEYNSRFLAWYLMPSYAKEPPEYWQPPEYYERLLSEKLATIEQCYWHFIKTRELQNKKRLREYPTYDYEAFLMSGTTFFDSEAMLWHNNGIRTPIKSSQYVEGLTVANRGRELAHAR